MKEINIALDLYSIFISILLLSGASARGKEGEDMRKSFFLMCLFDVGMTLGDLSNWACEGLQRPWYPMALKLGSVFFFACSGPLMFFFTKYILAFVPQEERGKQVYCRIVLPLCLLQVFLSFLSLKNGFYFSIGSGNTYVRGYGFWLSQALPALMYLVIGAALVRYRRHIRGRDLFFLSSYIFLPAVAELIQMANYGIGLMNTGITLSLPIIYINIQSEQELRLRQREKDLAQGRVDKMLRQIKPEFLDQVLEMIKRLCDTDPAQAQEAVLDFSVCLRGTMNAVVSDGLISLIRELSHTERYLKLEKLRLGDRLRVSWQVSEADFLLPPLSVQTVAEQAIRRGLSQGSPVIEIEVRTEEAREAYFVILSDNAPLSKEEEEERELEEIREKLVLAGLGTLRRRERGQSGRETVIELEKGGWEVL